MQYCYDMEGTTSFSAPISQLVCQVTLGEIEFLITNTTALEI